MPSRSPSAETPPRRTATAVSVDGSTVTLTAAGTYVVKGTLAGQVVIDAGDDADVTVVLDGAKITSSSTAAIAATSIDELTVLLADGSENTLADTASYADDADVNAALFSTGNLTLGGSGGLRVTGNGNDGIASKHGLLIESGTIAVEAADDGISGKDYVVVEGGSVTVTSGGDGIKADNDEDADSGYVDIAGGTVTVTSGGDGIDAATDVVMTGGTVAVTSGGGHATQPSDDASTKGIKSGVITVLEGGTVQVDSSDDAVHSDGAVRLAGARLTLASGDDAVHAEGGLQIDKGTVDVTASVEGLEGAAIAVTGGTVKVVASDDGVNAAGGAAETTETTESTDSTDADADADAGGGGGDGAPGGGMGGGEAVGDFSLTVTGGTLVVDAEGDGLDSNGTASISGGTVVVNGPTDGGNGALDVNGDFTVTGGTLIAAGSAGMVVTPSAGSEQGWVSATLDAALPAGSTVQAVDADGSVLATFVTSKTVQNPTYSSSAITAGESYTISTGGTAGGDSIGGLASFGELGSATEVATVTAGEAPAGGHR